MAVGFLVELGHVPAGKAPALCADLHALFPAALHRHADVVFRPSRLSAGGADAALIVCARRAVHADNLTAIGADAMCLTDEMVLNIMTSKGC